MELKRATKAGGAIATVVPDPGESDWWGFVGAVVDLLPAPPQERQALDLADGPTLESLYRTAGLEPFSAKSITVTWSYPDAGTALRALMSPGPMAGAAGVVGIAEVARTAEAFLEGFAADDGSYHLDSTATYVVGLK